ncbi:NAD-dependent epimerase/dehydratase family protein [Saccharopolyspora spinosa]|uniref:NAD-dependent epimerase/dehydratase family protein n=1 Tax=Saccharopolyspora spinosa TaxID=60894 RepID=UPI000237A57E|nr:NAD(P)-dependent oxidoreductase [Saccharopolyspora spinosa]
MSEQQKGGHELIAIVTGESGFIGRVLRRELEAAGWTVHGLSAGSSDLNAVDIDICSSDVEELFRDLAPDIVFHLAGISGPMLAADQPTEIVRVNCEGTANVLESAARAKTPRVVYAASVSAYAVGTTTRPEPDSLYATTKKYGEILIDLYRRRLGNGYTSVRVGSVYGPGRQTSNPIHTMIDDGLRGRPVRFNVNEYEPVIWIDDCARLLAGLSAVPHYESAYDAVAEMVGHTEIAYRISSLLGVPTEPYEGKRVDYPAGFDSSALVKATTVIPEVTLQDGIERAIRWRKAELDTYTPIANGTDHGRDGSKLNAGANHD